MPSAPSATELHDLIARRQLSPTELVESTLAHIDARNGSLGAIVTVLDAEATRCATAATRSQPDSLPPLFGLPFTVKDTIEVAGVRTTGGSRLLEHHVPERTAPVVEAIQRAGGVLVGKTNCPEFGIGNLDTDNLLFGRTRNPWDETRSPGGSSGGDSAAVAASLSSFGIGTDYGGSVRFPAHCTGISALRPTPGLVDQRGVLPHSATLPGRPGSVQGALQTIGFLARSVADLKRLSSVLGLDGGPAEAPPSCACIMAGDEIAVPDEMARAVLSCCEVLRSHGLRVEPRTAANLERAVPLLAALRLSEGHPEIAQLAEGRHDELTPLVREELERAPVPLAPGLWASISEVRDLAALELQRWPIWLTPVSSEPAFAIDEAPRTRAHLEGFCRAVTLLRLPAAVVTVATSECGLPIGVQVIGRPAHESQVLFVADLLERAFGRWEPACRAVP